MLNLVILFPKYLPQRIGCPKMRGIWLWFNEVLFLKSHTKFKLFVYVSFVVLLQQTSYSDMLDLAVQHIKGLQNQIQVISTLLHQLIKRVNMFYFENLIKILVIYHFLIIKIMRTQFL